jgi:hypothetical protein
VREKEGIQNERERNGEGRKGHRIGRKGGKGNGRKREIEKQRERERERKNIWKRYSDNK